ncbi:LemA family protein [Actinomycetota bacterium]
MTIALLVLLGLIVLAALWAVGVYNGLMKTRNLVQEAWAQIDTELKRRHDLIDNLVETVKGYAAHERGTFEEVTRARSGAVQAQQGGSPAEVAQAEAQLTQALVRLNAVAEAYPELKANQNFMALQQELTGTEDRIASARRYYNATVRDLNTKVDTVPTNFVASSFGVKKAEYFEAEGIERDPVKVDFGQGGGTGPQDQMRGPVLDGPMSDQARQPQVEAPQVQQPQVQQPGVQQPQAQPQQQPPAEGQQPQA